MRSRAVALPLACCLSMATSPPPRRAFSRSSTSCLIFFNCSLISIDCSVVSIRDMQSGLRTIFARQNYAFLPKCANYRPLCLHLKTSCASGDDSANEKRGSSRPRTAASREELGTANKNGELFAESWSFLDKTRYICAISPQFIAPYLDIARQSREHRGAARRGAPPRDAPGCPTLGHSAEKAGRRTLNEGQTSKKCRFPCSLFAFSTHSSR